MFSSSTILTLLPLLSLISGSPTPDLSKRCGSFIQPQLFQIVNESSPNTVYLDTGYSDDPVQVYQNVVSTSGGVVPTDRIYQIFGFANVPSTAYGCSISMLFPTGHPLTVTPPNGPSPRLDIYTFGVDQLVLGSPGVSNPWTWDSITSFNNPPATLFGTVTIAADGTSHVVNSATCPFTASGGEDNVLAFTLRIAEGVDVEAGVAYDWFTTDPAGFGPGPTGFYLSYDC